jgi:hypothetical protein
MMHRSCAIAVAAALVAIALFQLLLSLGVPLGHAAWGGRHAELGSGLRAASAVSAVLLLSAAVIVLGRAGMVRGPVAVYRRGTWVIVGSLALSALGNFASTSPWEQLLQGPVALMASLLCLAVARGPSITSHDVVSDSRTAPG